MKRKRLKTVAVSAVVGCLLLAFSVTAFASSGSGYTNYKDAVKATAFIKNATISAQFTVSDNETVLLSGNTILKLDNANKSAATNITVDGVTKTSKFSTDNGNIITKVGDKYYQVNKGTKKDGIDQQNLTASSSTVKLAEMLTDTLVGDVKNLFVQNGQTISVHLKGAQIPELARLALSAATENSSRMGDRKDNAMQGTDDSMKSVMDKMPKLSNMEVKSIAMTAVVDGNTLKDNNFTITITGQDANGISRELTLSLKATISDVGNTKTEALDTTGQTVTTIDSANKHRTNKHRNR